VFVSSPNGGTGYDANDRKKGGTGYIPITLQYEPYTATDARAHSIAAGDPAEPGVNDRTYKDKSNTAANLQDLKTINETKTAMKGKPVIVVVTLSKPMVFSEFEKDANAIVVHFGVQNQAVLDILTGNAEPSGLLPYQMPIDMKTVELQDEDITHDMICYRDTDGHAYDFGYGMSWKGVIHDARTAKYVNQVSKPVIEVKANRVSITCATPGAKIYFTQNGNTPSFTNEDEYSKPFGFKKGTIVKAIAKLYGVNNSNLEERDF
jgi:beta-glucosidase